MKAAEPFFKRQFFQTVSWKRRVRLELQLSLFVVFELLLWRHCDTSVIQKYSRNIPRLMLHWKSKKQNQKQNKTVS